MSFSVSTGDNYLLKYTSTVQQQSFEYPYSITVNAIYNTDDTGTMTNIDNNIYQPVRVGEPWWMAENLKATKYRNGDGITKIPNAYTWSHTTTGAYCNNVNNDANADIYGSRYNWYAVDDNRNIAPQGWHVPTFDEFLALIIFMGGEPGGGMKETGTTHWHTPNIGATNLRGFTALPAGFRHHSDGLFSSLTYSAYFWTSTVWVNYPHAINIIYWRSEAFMDPWPQRNGYSVRCVKD